MFYRLYTYLNKLFKLSFKDKRVEEKFQKAYIKDNVAQNIIAVKIAFVAYIAYYFVAYYVTPEDFFFNAVYTLPIPLILSIIFLFKINKENIKENYMFILFIFGVGIGYPPVMNIAITEHYQQLYITNFMLPIFASFVMYGAPFVVPLLSVSVLLLILLITLIIFPVDETVLIYYAFLVMVTFMVSATSGYLIEKGKRKNYLAIFIQEDLNTQLKLEQEENAKKEKVLQQQARLAQMGEMISMIAHQWRQPLGAISSTIISIQNKKQSGRFDLNNKEEREKYFEFSDDRLQNIDEYVQVLSATIDDFRNFFKPDKAKEIVPLSTPIKRALDIVEDTLRAKNIKLLSVIENDDDILMYQNEMMQVILNIIKNSEDNFLEKKIESPQIFVMTKEEGSTRTISIMDNGGGISPEVLPKIFDPYFSTKDEKNGTGLGLYMSKIMVEEHNNGKLYVENVDNGVCFKIELRLVS